jgi:hypothetical protein
MPKERADARRRVHVGHQKAGDLEKLAAASRSHLAYIDGMSTILETRQEVIERIRGPVILFVSRQQGTLFAS